ncbi:hypothetical protein [Hymenobacter seoulensis]
MALFFDQLAVDKQVSAIIAVHVDYGHLLPPAIRWQEICKRMVDLTSEIGFAQQRLESASERKRILGCIRFHSPQRTPIQ